MGKMKNILTAFILIISICLTAQLKTALPSDIKTGAQQLELYLPKLKNKRVAIVANITTVIGTTHLVDTLLKHNVQITKIFSPEHGFRGTSDAGEKVLDGKDKKTGLPIVSLYGKHKKPTKEDLKNVDVVIYDIQDVGVRFYTYISTMTYVMEACADSKKEVIILDRPNPNGFYIDGPVLDKKYTSFLGLHKVPLVYGMTYGEYAKMIVGEKWLNASKKTLKLTIVPVIGYTHNNIYSLLIKPSPNLPNDTSILLYPSLGLFEGTLMSIGRGTEFPFQVIGHPDLKAGKFKFMPQPAKGAKDPKYNGQACYGYDLRPYADSIKANKKVSLRWLITSYNELKREDFFDENFNYHAGNNLLQKQIKEGYTEEQIRNTWQKDIDTFKAIRKKYVLYPDFE